MATYRCSCCDKVRNSKDFNMIVWDTFDMESPTVGVCNKCTKKLVDSGHTGVLQYLQENDEDF